MKLHLDTPDAHNQRKQHLDLYLMYRGKWPMSQIDPTLKMGQLKGHFTPGDHWDFQIQNRSLENRGHWAHSTPLVYHSRFPDDGPNSGELSDVYDDMTILEFLLMTTDGVHYPEHYIDSSDPHLLHYKHDGDKYCDITANDPAEE